MSGSEESSVAKSLRESSQEERRLLKEEQEAELKLLEANERLAVAIARLEQEQARVERRKTRVESAVQNLLQKQEARVAGPQTFQLVETTAGAHDGVLAPGIPMRDDSARQRLNGELNSNSEDNRPP